MPAEGWWFSLAKALQEITLDGLIILDILLLKTVINVYNNIYKLPQ
jgi:hypothetical protein